MELDKVDIQIPTEATDEAMIALARSIVENPDPVRWDRDHNVIWSLTPEQRTMFGAKSDWLAGEAREEGRGELEQDYLRLARLAERVPGVKLRSR